METAKLFLNGRSQAVRLPKAFRFEGLTEVYIRREGERIILSPTRKPPMATPDRGAARVRGLPRQRQQPRGSGAAREPVAQQDAGRRPCATCSTPTSASTSSSGEPGGSAAVTAALLQPRTGRGRRRLHRHRVRAGLRRGQEQRRPATTARIASSSWSRWKWPTSTAPPPRPTPIVRAATRGRRQRPSARWIRRSPPTPCRWASPWSATTRANSNVCPGSSWRIGRTKAHPMTASADRWHPVANPLPRQCLPEQLIMG